MTRIACVTRRGGGLWLGRKFQIQPRQVVQKSSYAISVYGVDSSLTFPTQQHGTWILPSPSNGSSFSTTSDNKNDDTVGDEAGKDIDYKQKVVMNVEYGNQDDDDEDEGYPKKGNVKAETLLDASKYTEEIEIRMPDMGEGNGKVVKWYKQKGDLIKRQDVLCDIETPDFTFGMSTEDEENTIMGEILVPAGSDAVDDGTVLCITLHKPDDDDKEKK